MAEQRATGANDGFAVARRGGYDREQVDARIASLSRRIAELEARRAELEAIRSPEEAVRGALEQVGEEVSGVLQRAYETARKITANAEREAAAHLQVAEQDAAAAIARAEQRVRALDADTDRVWVERERILADARDLAQQLVALADAADMRLPPEEPHPEPSHPETTTLPSHPDRLEPSLARLDDRGVIEAQLDVAFAAEEPAAELL